MAFKYQYICSALIMIVFQSCAVPERNFTIEGHLILLDSLNVEYTDTVQEAIILTYKEKLDDEMNRVLVKSEHVMEKGTPEGLLNNYVADLVLERGNQLYQPQDGNPIDFCLLNYGGLRVPLPKGEVTSSRVFELLPFENEMVVVTLDGVSTNELFNYLANATRGMPVAGIRLEIKDNKPKTIFIKDQPFNLNRNYKILTSDYLADGGDNMNFFLQPLNYELLGMKVRDAIILHMEETQEKGEKISSRLDGRISVVL